MADPVHAALASPRLRPTPARRRPHHRRSPQPVPHRHPRHPIVRNQLIAQLRRRLRLIDHPHTLAGGEDLLVAPPRLAGVDDLPEWSRPDLGEIQAGVLDAGHQEVGREPVEGGREEDVS